MSFKAGGSHWCPTSQQLLGTLLFPSRAHQLWSGGWWSSYISPEVSTVRGCLGSDFSWCILLAHDFWLWWERGHLGWATLQPAVTYLRNFYISFNSRFLPGSKQSSMAIPCAKNGRWGWQPHCPNPNQARMWVWIHWNISPRGHPRTVGFSLCSFFIHALLWCLAIGRTGQNQQDKV